MSRTAAEDWLIAYAITGATQAHSAKIFYGLAEGEFYDERNRVLFEIAKDLFENDQTPDAISLTNKLLAQGTATKEIYTHIMSLSGREVRYAKDGDVDANIASVKESFARERIAEEFQRASRSAMHESVKIPELFEATLKAQLLISSLAADMKNPESIITHGYNAIGTLKRKSKEGTNQIFTGIPGLDRCFGGLQDNDLMIIAARPNVGKTVLLTQIFRACLPQRKKALFFTLEMKPEQIYARLQSINSGVSSSVFRNSESVTEDQLALLDAEFDRMRIQEYDKYLFVEGGFRNPTIDRLMLHAYKQKHSTGLDIILLDYLQLLTPRKKNINRPDLEIKDIMHDLKALAEALNVPIVVVSALNREAAEMKFSKEKGHFFITPQLGHLAGSSGIEYIADQIILIHRPTKDGTDAELHLSKNRWGELATINVCFDGATSQFIPLQF